MRAVDTNVLVRLLTRDHPEQGALAEAFVAPGAWVSHVVLIEAVWVLKAVYGVERDRIGRGVGLLLTHASVVLQEPDVVSAALIRFQEKGAPEFSDCMILEIARRAGHLPLGTFDRRLGKLEGAERL